MMPSRAPRLLLALLLLLASPPARAEADPEPARPLIVVGAVVEWEAGAPPVPFNHAEWRFHATVPDGYSYLYAGPPAGRYQVVILSVPFDLNGSLARAGAENLSLAQSESHLPAYVDGVTARSVENVLLAEHGGTPRHLTLDEASGYVAGSELPLPSLAFKTHLADRYYFLMRESVLSLDAIAAHFQGLEDGGANATFADRGEYPLVGGGRADVGTSEGDVAVYVACRGPTAGDPCHRLLLDLLHACAVSSVPIASAYEAQRVVTERMRQTENVSLVLSEVEASAQLRENAGIRALIRNVTVAMQVRTTVEQSLQRLPAPMREPLIEAATEQDQLFPVLVESWEESLADLDAQILRSGDLGLQQEQARESQQNIFLGVLGLGLTALFSGLQLVFDRLDARRERLKERQEAADASRSVPVVDASSGTPLVNETPR